MQWDTVQNNALKEALEGTDVSEAKAKELVEVYLRNCVRNIREYKPVTIVNMGFFYIDPRKVNRLLLKLIKSFREGRTSKEEFDKGYAKYRPVYAIAKTHAPRTGKAYLREMKQKAREAKKTEQANGI